MCRVTIITVFLELTGYVFNDWHEANEGSVHEIVRPDQWMNISQDIREDKTS